MKSIVRFSTLLLVLAIVLLPALSARAADQPCFGLQKADCDLLYAAFTPDGTAKINSANFAFKLTVDASVAGDASSTGKVNVEGTGLAGKDAAAKDPMTQALFQLALKLSASGMGQAKAQDFSTDIRVVAGSLFFNVGGKWTELSLQEAATTASGMAGSMGGAGGLPGGAGASAAATPDPATVQALLKALSDPAVMKVEAKDGPSMDGKATREFTDTIDLVALLKSKDFAPVLDQMKKSSTSSANFDPKQLDALKGLKLVLTTNVGKDDKIVYKLGLNIKGNWDDAGAKTLKVKGAGNFTLDFSLQLSKINQAVKVDKPTGATKTTVSQLIGQFMGAGAGGAAPARIPTRTATPKK